MRPMLVSGQFYEEEFTKLDKQINECFSHKLGPGDLPIRVRKNKILGIIAPHAGYQFSGPCAAWSYKKLAESKFTDTFILLGPSHLGSNDIVISTEDFQTPFGKIKNDQEVCNQLLKNSFIIEDNE